MTYFVEGLTKTADGQNNVRRIGEYETLESAVKAAEQVIDEFLAGKLKGKMTAGALFALYQELGEVPFIFSDDARTMNVRGFNHFKYAMTRCGALCTPAK